MQRILCLILASLMGTVSLFAQLSPDESAAAYSYRKAKKYLDKYDYFRAMPYLKHAVNLAPHKAEYSFGLGKSLFEIGDPAAALPHLDRAYAINKGVSAELYLYRAKALHQAGRYEEAAASYADDRKLRNPDDPQYAADNLAMQQCNAAASAPAPAAYTITNLGEFINTRFHEYGATFGEDDNYMLFTSRRPRNPSSVQYGLYHSEDLNEEVYHARRNEGSWMQSRVFSKPIPLFTHDAPVALANNGQTLVYYVDRHYGDIYVSNKEGEKWSKRQSLGTVVNTDEHHEPSVFITEGGSALYFVSTKPGGQGSLDIYVSQRTGGTTDLAKASWTEGANLGSRINTPYREDAPFLSADGKRFYFSSEGHNSMGGYDIFRCDRLPDGSWSAPVNLGAPINSTGDDIYYVENADGKGFYFSSDRPGGMGGMDIYFGEPSKEVPAGAAPVVVSGTVLDQEGGKPVKAEVRLVNTVTREVVASEYTDPSGGYALDVPPGTRDLKLDVAVPTCQPGTGSPMSLGATNLLSGKVVDQVSREPLSATLEVMDPASNKVIKTIATNGGTGNYLADLESGRNYRLKVSSDKYMPYYEDFTVTTTGKVEAHQLEIGLQKFNAFDKFVLNWQLFDPTSSELKAQSIADLDHVAEVMKSYPDIKLQIVGHTDSDGSDVYNQTLSESRARAVASYLERKGVSASRLSSIGRGEKEPIYPNTDPETKRWNRRVELFVQN